MNPWLMALAGFAGAFVAGSFVEWADEDSLMSGAKRLEGKPGHGLSRSKPPRTPEPLISESSNLDLT